MSIIIFIIALFLIGSLVYAATRKKTVLFQPEALVEKTLLESHVLFYQQLGAKEKIRFELSLQKFLHEVKITGIKITVEDMDRVFVAASAIIPVFAFKDWEYSNIHEVLLYPDSFNDQYQLEGTARNTLGMVGNGPMQFVMILSRHDLREGFLNSANTSNTGIHEFVHLIDKEDGSTDGLPEVLLQHKYALPWLQRIHQEIQAIRNGKSDINVYGATNETEFFAVAAEYFFKQPHLMQQRHPELFNMLSQIFMPTVNNKDAIFTNADIK